LKFKYEVNELGQVVAYILYNEIIKNYIWSL
jgi:hypothetical protein